VETGDIGLGWIGPDLGNSVLLTSDENSVIASEIAASSSLGKPDFGHGSHLDGKP